MGPLEIHNASMVVQALLRQCNAHASAEYRCINKHSWLLDIADFLENINYKYKMAML